MNGKRKLDWTRKDFQKRYRKVDCSGGWSKRCSIDYNRLKNKPAALRTFCNDMKINMKKKDRAQQVQGFSHLFGKKPMELKEPVSKKLNSPVDDQKHDATELKVNLKATHP